MKKVFTVLIVMLFSIASVFSQSNLLWAKRIGGLEYDSFHSSILDTSGNLYITGDFYGTVDFDPGDGTYNLTAVGAYDSYISKLDTSGNFIWAKQIGGTGGESVISIALDASENIYTTGWFTGTADFDPGTGTYNLISAGGADIFISKLDASGNFIWAKQIRGTNHCFSWSIALDAAGNVYTTGDFKQTCDFDPGAGTYNLTSAGGADIFISKLDVFGNFVWAKRMGGTTDEQGGHIAWATSGDIYSTGRFAGTIDFDPGTGVFNLTSAGEDDMYISKLDVSGNFVWAKRVGGTGTDSGGSITFDAVGNFYFTGVFQGIADLDPGTGTYNLTSAGGYDIFITKLDVSGNFVWAKRMGGTNDDACLSIAVDSSANVYSTGRFNGMADFDPGTDTVNLNSSGEGDIFISKLNNSGSFVWAKQMGGASGDSGQSIDVHTSGNVYVYGGFQGIADFDPGAGTYNLTSDGGQDIFVVKLDQCDIPPAQPVIIIGSASPCEGTAENYSVTNVTDVTYTWTFPVGWVQTGGGTTSAITVTVGSVSGNISVTPSNECGIGIAQTLAVTPTNVPAQPSFITGSTTPCQGTSANYSVTMVSGVTYLWAFPAGWIQNGGGNSNAIIATVGDGSGNITVTPSNECGIGVAQSLAVMPSDVPLQPGTITGAVIPCQGSSQNYSVTAEEGVTYSWTLPIGWIQTGGSTTNAIIVTVGGVAGNITVTPSNTCGNGDEQTLAVSPSTVPQQAVVITGATTPCEGTSENYSVNYETGVTYEWIFPGGWIVTGNSNYEVTVTVGNESGNIIVTPINECGIGNVQSLAVVPIDLPLQPSDISGATSPCQGTSENYSVNEVTNVVYTWVLPAGWIQTGGASTHTITVIVGGGSGNISVIPSNACGNGSAKTLAVSTSDIPSQPENITGTISPCEGTSGNYSVNNVPDVTYTWTLPAGWVQTGGGNTNVVTVTVGSGSGNIIVTPSNTCGIGVSKTMAVAPAFVPSQPGIISGPTSPYQATSVNYSITNITGISYSWTFPSGWVQTGGGNTNVVTVAVGSGSGNITVIPSNGCGSGPVRILGVVSLIKESATNGSWNLANTWLPPGIPTASQDIIINDNVTIDDAPLAVCNNMTINTGGMVQIAAGNSLTVVGILTNNVGNTGLVVASGGSLIEVTAGIAVTVIRDYTAVEKHLISVPISGANAGLFFGLNFQNHTEPTNLYNDIIDPSTPINIMQGYAFRNIIAGEIQFTGFLNTGTLGSLNNVTRFGAGNNYGWNLVGNPYSSNIDWDAAAGWTKTNVDNATYRHVNDATWASYVGGVGANGGTRYIASCQGFFVTVKEAQTTGTLKMDNNVRTHNATTFFKEEIDDIIRLEISGNGYTDETVIRILDVATTGFDSDWDAHKLFGSIPEAPAIYSSGNGMMAINSLPVSNTFPIGVKAGVPGAFTITATETSDFADVILEDLITGTITDLKSSSYTFNYDLNLDDRFIVQSTPASVTQNPADLINIYSYNYDIYVSVPANTGGEIVVYNLMGQEVAHSIIKDVTNKITLNKSAYYIVKVLGTEIVVTKKVFVK